MEQIAFSSSKSREEISHLDRQGKLIHRKIACTSHSSPPSNILQIFTELLEAFRLKGEYPKHKMMRPMSQKSQNS